MNVGVRVDAQTSFDPKLSPRAALLWRAVTDGTLKAVYAEAFRSPSYYERLFEAPGSLTPNPSLRPETVRSADLSWEQRLGSKRGVVGAFYQHFENLSTYTALEGGGGQFQNAGRIANYGANVSFEETAGKLRFGGNVTLASARRTTESGSEQLPVAPSLYGNARVLYTPGEAAWSNPSFALATSIVGPRLANVASNGTWPTTPRAPVQVELRATITGTLAKGLEYRLMGNYALSSQSAYAIGPTQIPADPNTVNPQLGPVNRLVVLAGLQFAL